MGKDSVLARLKQKREDLYFVVTATSRWEGRGGEAAVREGRWVRQLQGPRGVHSVEEGGPLL